MLSPLLEYLPLLSTVATHLGMLEHSVTTSLPALIAKGILDADTLVKRAADRVYPAQSNEITALRNDLQAFTTTAATTWATKDDLHSSRSSSSSLSSRSKEPKIAPPQVFSGKREDCKAFVAHCVLVFSSQPTMYPDDRVKIRYALSYLGDNPKRFFLDYISQLDLPHEERPTAIKTFKSFSTTLTDAFGIKQSAKMTAWNDIALCSQYTLGLKDSIQDNLGDQERILDFEKLVAKAHQIDNLQRSNLAYRNPPVRASTITTHSRQTHAPRLPANAHPATATPGSSSSSSAPDDKSGPTDMELGQAVRLSPQERARRKEENLYYYCGKTGHIMAQCAGAKKARQRTLHNVETDTQGDHVEFTLGNQ